MAGGMVRVRRVYEEPEPGDGTRVLVDRIWPRGLAKAKAALDEWCRTSRHQTSCARGTATTRTALRNSAAATSWSCKIPGGRKHWRTCADLRGIGN